ncbi:hypothetical protein R50345_08305 [Paenibacillus sp. FSL R5-0345]|nr:hypothetical protein R50345_08305 [Paenibacillus sp. FSL R5-0345]
MFYNVKLTEELRASEWKRKSLDRMKKEWIVNISHDIKNLISSQYDKFLVCEGAPERMRYAFLIMEIIKLR